MGAPGTGGAWGRLARQRMLSVTDLAPGALELAEGAGTALTRQRRKTAQTQRPETFGSQGAENLPQRLETKREPHRSICDSASFEEKREIRVH